MKKYLLLGAWLLALLPYAGTTQSTTDAVINSTLSGRVVDNKTGVGLSGASVKIKGTTHEVVTGADGIFNFKTGQKLPYILIISYVGYQPIETTADKTSFRFS